MQNPKKTAAKALTKTLRFKLVAGSSLLVLGTVIILTAVSIQSQRSQIRSQLHTRGKTVAGLLAYNARYGVQIGDKPILDKILGGVMDDPDVIYCVISDREGKVITSYNQNEAEKDVLSKMSMVKRDSSSHYTNKNGQEILNIAWPVTIGPAGSADAGAEKGLSDLEDDFFGEDEEPVAAANSALKEKPDQRVIGAVQLGITMKNMRIEIEKAVWTTIGWSTAILAVGFSLAFWIGSVISGPIRRVVNMLNDISEGEGDLSQRIHIKSSDETGDLAAGFNTFMDKFQEIKKISVFLNELADGGGDLTKRLDIASQDEIGMLAKGFDRFVDKLHEIISIVAANTGMISQASQTVSDAVVKLARDLDEVARQSGEVAQSSSDISQTIDKTNRNVSDVNDMINATERSSAAGVTVVHEARTGMGRIADTIRASSEVVAKLDESSRKIGDTITTITEIADQTKLIAINAAIEASRVGAQGKGFSVVAEEIRRLAARVTKATQEISFRIKAILEDADRVSEAMRKGIDEAGKGLDLSDRSESSLDNISHSVSDARSRINQIAVSSSEQAMSISNISRNINSISESAHQSSDGVSKAAKSMQELNKEVQELKQLVGRFVLEKQQGTTKCGS